MAGLISFIGGVPAFYVFKYFPIFSVLLIISSGLFLILKKRKYALLILFLAGFFYSGLRYIPPEALEKGGLAVITCIPSPPVLNKDNFYSISQTLKIKEGKFSGGEPVLYETALIHPEDPLKEGRIYKLLVNLKVPEQRANPGAFHSKRPLAEMEKIISEGPAGFWETTRADLNRYFESRFDKKSAGFLMSLTTGERSLLDPELRNIFNTDGIGHLLSISGTHFAVFSLFIFFMIKSLMKLLPLRAIEKITIYLTPDEIGAILSFPVLLGYLLLSGGDVPAIRSFIMITLFLLGLLIGRKRAWLNALLFAALLLILWEPSVIFDISFQLSFLAVFFIGMFAEKEKETKGKVKKYLVGPLLITLSATLGLLPLTAFTFHMASLISPLANFVIVPLVGFALLPVLVLSSFSYLLSGWYPFPALSDYLGKITIKLSELFAAIPFSSIPMPSFPLFLTGLCYLVLLYYFSVKKSRWVLSASILPFLLWAAFSLFKNNPPTVTMLDVGDTECSVIELPGGKTFVLDSGKSGFEAAAYLKSRGVQTIDALILSHPHLDHTGGAENLMKNFRVKEIWDNGLLTYEGEAFKDIPKRTLSRGDYIEGKGYRLTVLHPYPGYVTVWGQEYLAENNSSLVLRLENRKGKSILLTGDIELEAEEDLLPLGEHLKSDIIKIPHHASRYSAYGPFIQAVSARSALISVGRDNNFGHPDEEMLEALAGTRIYRTDLDGALRVRLGQKPEITFFREFVLKRAPGFKGELHNLKVLFSSF